MTSSINSAASTHQAERALLSARGESDIQAFPRFTEQELIEFLSQVPQETRQRFIHSVLNGVDALGLPPLELARVRTSIRESLAAANPNQEKPSEEANAPDGAKSPFYYIGKHLPEFFSDWGDDLHDEMIERKGISMLLSETSRWSGHASSELLTAAATMPVTAPVTAEAGAVLGGISTGTGFIGGVWDFYVNDDTNSITSAAVGGLSELLQQSVKEMLPPEAKPIAHLVAEIYQTGFRELFYQLGK